MLTAPKSLRYLKQSYIWAILALIISSLPLLVQDPDAHSEPLISLATSPIFFKQGHDFQWAASNHVYTDWTPITLPHNWWQSGHKHMGATGWYRIPFKLDAAFEKQSLVVSLGFVGTLSEIYLNGEHIGGEGSFSPVSLPPQRTLHAANLPAHLLHFGATDNVLAVRVKSLVGAGGLLSNQIQIYSQESFWDIKEQVEYTRETWKIIVFAICLVGFCVFTIISYLVQKRYRLTYRSTAWVAYACGCGVLYHSHLFQDSDGLPEFVVLIYFMTTILLPLGIYTLALSVSGLKKRKWINLIISLIVCSYTLIALANPEHFHLAALAYAILWILLTPLVFGLAIKGIYAREPNALAVFIALFIFSSASSLELFSIGFGWLPYATLFWGPIEVGVLGFVLTMSWVLLKQYARIYKREQALRHQLLKIQDDERQRIGHNLHDSIAQDLIGLQYELKLLQAQMGSEISENIHTLSNYTQETLEEVRALAEDFQPFGKRNCSLVESIEQWQAQLSKRYHCDFENNIPSIDIDTSIAETVYRIIQEATQNACRHGRAEVIKIQLYLIDEHHIRLQIQDNGRGFNTVDINPKRLGINFMRDRAEACGGTLTLDSEIGTGTTISTWLPIRDDRYTSTLSD